MLWNVNFSLLPSCHSRQDVTEEKYVITPSIQEAAIIVTNTKEPLLKLNIRLTSPIVREQVEKEAAGGMKSSCLISGAKRPSVPSEEWCITVVLHRGWWCHLNLWCLQCFSSVSVLAVFLGNLRTCSTLKRYVGFALQQKLGNRSIDCFCFFVDFIWCIYYISCTTVWNLYLHWSGLCKSCVALVVDALVDCIFFHFCSCFFFYSEFSVHNLSRCHMHFAAVFTLCTNKFIEIQVLLLLPVAN